MSDTRRVLEAVGELWNDAPAIFGGDWTCVREKLLADFAWLDAHPSSQEEAVETILATFAQYPAAHDALVRRISKAPPIDRGGYEPLPGRQSPIDLDSGHVCPEGDYEWIAQRVGQRVPTCPKHHLPLIRRKSNE